MSTPLNVSPTHDAAQAWAWSGAFLLVIPGAATIGAGFGMLSGQLVPYSVIGFGAGCVLWGLIAALRNS